MSLALAGGGVGSETGGRAVGSRPLAKGGRIGGRGRVSQPGRHVGRVGPGGTALGSHPRRPDHANPRCKQTEKNRAFQYTSLFTSHVRVCATLNASFLMMSASVMEFHPRCCRAHASFLMSAPAKFHPRYWHAALAAHPVRVHAGEEGRQERLSAAAWPPPQHAVRGGGWAPLARPLWAKLTPA